MCSVFVSLAILWDGVQNVASGSVRVVGCWPQEEVVVVDISLALAADKFTIVGARRL
jgi:hypothetical protein